MSNRKRAIRRRRDGMAWLAVIALLVNVLLPAALLAAAPGASTTGVGFCGAAHGNFAPAGGPTVPAVGHHCILCLVAGVAPAPAPPASLAAPRFVGTADAPSLPIRPAPHCVPFAAAQPRGPPVAA